MQPFAASPASVLLWTRLLVLDLDVEAVGQPFDGAREIELLGLAHERDQVAFRPTPEAVVELVRRVDGEARRPLLVERTTPQVAAAGFAELRARGNHRNHVGRCLHLVDGRVLDPGHG